jgi:hypothetical protein
MPLSKWRNHLFECKCDSANLSYQCDCGVAVPLFVLGIDGDVCSPATHMENHYVVHPAYCEVCERQTTMNHVMHCRSIIERVARGLD